VFLEIGQRVQRAVASESLHRDNLSRIYNLEKPSVPVKRSFGNASSTPPNIRLAMLEI
jgi:hypothetical protein